MAHTVPRIEVMDGTFLMSRPGYYFGCGLEAVPEVMDRILDRSVVAELGVTAISQQLVVQEIDQIPDQPTDLLGGKSPQQILSGVWQKHTDVPFSAYSMRSTDMRSSLVKGTLYEIDLDDAYRLTEWSLVLPFEQTAGGERFWPGWKYWDHNIELTDGRIVETLTIDPKQAVDRAVDGETYDPYLADVRVTSQVIQDFVDGLEK